VDNPKLPANLHLPPLYARARNVLRQNDRPVRALAARLRKVLGDRIQPEDYPLVRRWCELEFLLSAAFTEIYNRGLVDSASGEPRAPSLTLIYSRLLSEQRAIGAELGMSPKSRLAIKADSRRAPFDARFEITEEDAARVVEVAKNYADNGQRTHEGEKRESTESD
jgi:phage terminase small subunit